MATNILMPALSPTMEEGKLAKWLVKEGDTVKSGDILAEIETDKATMEFEAVDEGKIGKILVPEGSEGVKVNAPIAVLLGDGEKLGEVNIPAAMANPAAKRDRDSKDVIRIGMVPAPTIAAQAICLNRPFEDLRTESRTTPPGNIPPATTAATASHSR